MVEGHGGHLLPFMRVAKTKAQLPSGSDPHADAPCLVPTDHLNNAWKDWVYQNSKSHTKLQPPHMDSYLLLALFTIKGPKKSHNRLQKAL